jgi:hypothetical protein
VAPGISRLCFYPIILGVWHDSRFAHPEVTCWKWTSPRRVWLCNRGMPCIQTRKPPRQNRCLNTKVFLGSGIQALPGCHARDILEEIHIVLRSFGPPRAFTQTERRAVAQSFELAFHYFACPLDLLGGWFFVGKYRASIFRLE